MPTNLLAQLLGRAAAQPSEADIKLEEAKKVITSHPRGQEAMKGTKHIFNNPILPWINGKISKLGGKWPESHGRSFAIPPLRTIFMAPDTPDYTDTLAHELGHIQQWDNDVPLQNDESADFLLKDLLQMQQIKRDIVPEPYTPLDPKIAQDYQDSGWSLRTEKEKTDINKRRKK